VSRRRTTFGKLQRDRDKQAKQKAKQERRAERAEHDDEPEETPEAAPVVDQSKILAQLADLHAAFDDGQISFDDFETRREELTNQLQIE
jgi:hypothetical protein